MLTVCFTKFHGLCCDVCVHSAHCKFLSATLSELTEQLLCIWISGPAAIVPVGELSSLQVAFLLSSGHVVKPAAYLAHKFQLRCSYMLTDIPFVTCVTQAASEEDKVAGLNVMTQLTTGLWLNRSSWCEATTCNSKNEHRCPW